MIGGRGAGPSSAEPGHTNRTTMNPSRRSLFILLALLLGASFWTLLVPPESLAQRGVQIALSAAGIAFAALALGYCGMAFVQGRKDQSRLGHPWHTEGA